MSRYEDLKAKGSHPFDSSPIDFRPPQSSERALSAPSRICPNINLSHMKRIKTYPIVDAKINLGDIFVRDATPAARRSGDILQVFDSRYGSTKRHLPTVQGTR
ncbi:hypothetical protein O0L34_g7438 [Tuta absoluta]|nr:hypothetical protein O0L34_g7438 [Tuta absoluta]